MKLAEALQERADLSKNIEELKNRLKTNVLVQEGEKPSEDPLKLKQDLDNAIERFHYLVAKINLTNSLIKVDGITLTEMIAKKDALLVKIQAYKDVAYSGSQGSYRARNSEIKIKSTIIVSNWQSKIDSMSKELRLLDNKLQESNWAIDLIE